MSIRNFWFLQWQVSFRQDINCDDRRGFSRAPGSYKPQDWCPAVSGKAIEITCKNRIVEHTAKYNPVRNNQHVWFGGFFKRNSILKLLGRFGRVSCCVNNGLMEAF